MWHRSRTPGNVVMPRDDRPVLVDLELAVRPGTTIDPAETPGFTDPEHLGPADGPALRPAPRP
ncbi:hypothetical protein AB0C76_18100 [Kitasatospora sp. NPDC048722]|uniref:hypothetical protein n=1 Tax=Kitasatospora sp. NPDC048722 TaxID=3155639 RepID=UPI003402CB58